MRRYYFYTTNVKKTRGALPLVTIKSPRSCGRPHGLLMSPPSGLSLLLPERFSSDQGGIL